MEAGVRRFIDDMTKSGLDCEVESGLVIYRITPVDGAYAGVPVETGVGAGELRPWPQAPPHWIHLPSDIVFPRTNSDRSPKPGWLMHSRDLRGWGDAAPAICWLSHVRAVLSEAITCPMRHQLQ